MAAIKVTETLSLKENPGVLLKKLFFLKRRVCSDAVTMFEKSLPYKEFPGSFETVCGGMKGVPSLESGNLNLQLPLL